METKNTSHKVHRRLLPAALAVIGTPLVLFMAGVFVKGLAVREYRIESPKVREPFRLVLLSDLHQCAIWRKYNSNS
jgi:predicted MPP superfamily phosphohydrolase